MSHQLCLHTSCFSEHRSQTRVGEAGQPRVSAIDLERVRAVCLQYLALEIRESGRVCLPGGSSELGQLDWTPIPGPTQAVSPFQSLPPSGNISSISWG